MHFNRRQILASLAAASSPGLLQAQAAFPSRNIEIVVGAAAGGATDIGARKAGEMLAENLGQPVFVTNKAGAGGGVAAAHVARAEKSGHVVGMASDSSVLINPLLMTDLNYKFEDFQLLSPLYMGAFVLAVAKDFPANNMKEFVAEVRRRGDVPCGMFGQASLGRLLMEMLIGDANMRLTPVPYKGEPDIVRDVLGGNLYVFFAATASVMPQYKAGTIKVLGVSSTERLQLMPDIPTFKESGMTNTVYRWFHGLMVPAGTPKAAVDRYADALRRIVPSDRFRSGIAADLAPTFMEPAAFTEMALATRERVQAIIKARNIKV